MTETPYKLTSDDGTRFQIDFEAATENVVGLKMSPGSLEPQLKNGKWLILSFAIWDSKDRPAISVACNIARNTAEFQVGVRPFEFGDEFSAWAPGFSSDAGSLSVSENESAISITTRTDDHPVWFAIRDGEILAALVGAREQSDVEQFVHENLA